MPRVIVTEGAARGLDRCRRVLSARAPEAARAAGQAIARQLLVLEQTPDMGRPFDDLPELRELLIPFGEAGYVALYRYERERDAVYILAFRHQREAGY